MPGTYVLFDSKGNKLLGDNFNLKNLLSLTALYAHSIYFSFFLCVCKMSPSETKILWIQLIGYTASFLQWRRGGVGVSWDMV